MSRKIPAVLLGIFLLITGAVICIKPVCGRVIHEAFLGRAVALRANDVIWKWCPDMELNEAVVFQDMVQGHRQLDRAASKYLDALVKYRWSGDSFEAPDIRGNLGILNRDIVRRAESESGTELSADRRELFMEELYEAEYPVIEILNELPYYIRNFGALAWMALGLYGILTSWQFLGLMILFLLGLGFWMYRAEGEKTDLLRQTGILFLTDGVILGILVPAFIRAVSLPVTNRLIGRAWEIDTSAILYRGIGFAVIGILLLFIWNWRIRQAGEQKSF